MNNITNNKQKETIVWINRGWIPHHCINTKNNNEILKAWYEPKQCCTSNDYGKSKTETPGMFSLPSRINYNTAKNEHNNEEPRRSINKLLWMDRTVRTNGYTFTHSSSSPKPTKESICNRRVDDTTMGEREAGQ